MVTEIISQVIAAAVAVVIGAIVALVIQRRTRIKDVPARIDEIERRTVRVEGAQCILLEAQQAQSDALLVMIRCQRGEQPNGQLEAAESDMMTTRTRMREFLSGGAHPT